MTGAGANAPPRTEEERLANLPRVLLPRINLPERPIGGKKKRKKTQAQEYAATNHFQPRLELLNAGELCIILAPDPTLDNVPAREDDDLCFRIHLGGNGKYSRLLYMAVVEDVDQSEQTVTWVYFKPRKMTNRKERRMAGGLAMNPKNWVLCTPTMQTSDWDPDEMILNWVKNPKERGWCIPEQQYADVQKVLLAMEATGDVESEENAGSDMEE